MQFDVLIPLLLALKGTTLWKGWGTGKEIILGKSKRTAGSLYNEFIKNNLDKIDDGFKFFSGS